MAGRGGFKDNPELAREAGRKGGEVVKARYGSEYYQRVGKKGGDSVLRQYGVAHLAIIGAKGGLQRGVNAAKDREADPAPAKPVRPRGRPRSMGATAPDRKVAPGGET